MFNEEFNHAKSFTFDSTDLPYTDLDTFVKENGNKLIEVKSVFINQKAKYGPRGCIVCSTLKINVPAHLNKDITKILNRPDMIEAINAGKCGFMPRQYEDDKGIIRNTGNFIDIN